MSNIEHFSAMKYCMMSQWKPRNLPQSRFYPCLVLRAVPRSRSLANYIWAPCAPSHTGIGNFPQPRPWKRSQQTITTQLSCRQTIPPHKRILRKLRHELPLTIVWATIWVSIHMPDKKNYPSPNLSPD